MADSLRNVGALKRRHIESMQLMLPVKKLNPDFDYLYFEELNMQPVASRYF